MFGLRLATLTYKNTAKKVVQKNDQRLEQVVTTLWALQAGSETLCTGKNSENRFPDAVKKSAIEIYTRMSRDEVRTSFHNMYVEMITNVPQMDSDAEIAVRDRFTLLFECS